MINISWSLALVAAYVALGIWEVPLQLVVANFALADIVPCILSCELILKPFFHPGCSGQARVSGMFSF